MATTSMRLAHLALGLALAAMIGCGSGADADDALAEVNSTNIQKLANLYFTYQTKNEWRGPADEAEFKGFIRTFNPQKLARIGVDAAATDALFTSERDGQPFKIRYGVRGSAMGSSEPVVFEAVGVDGRREVGFLNMTQREVDDAEYERLWSGKGPPTAPTRPG
jgi:hypothetical protein